MQTKSHFLFLEIDNQEFIFAASEGFDDNFKLLKKKSFPIKGIINKKILDLELICETFKDIIYSFEKELNITFKEVIIILDNLENSLISFEGYVKLNGSQLVKENVIYIINSLKSKIVETEEKKTILHIFNSKYSLDKENSANLPIGLFGNFYSHELSIVLLNKNDEKNLKIIFEKCNLKIKKVISKSFLKGVSVMNKNLNLETFFKVEISDMFCQLIFFQNSALRFKQDFNFGLNLILKDISKVIGLKDEEVKNILAKSNFSKEKIDNEFIEKSYFTHSNFRKIKKKLIVDVASARIQELSEIILFKNINILSLLKKKIPIFLVRNNEINFNIFNNIFITFFSKEKNYDLNLIDEVSTEQIFSNANNIIQYGWKNEALPIVQEKKSMIARLFNLFFD